MEAGEITATLRIEKSGTNYLLSLNGTHKKSRTLFMDSKKKRVSAVEYASYSILDLKRKLLGGPFAQTSAGGIFHDTMSKKQVQDTDKLESIGMRAHDSFIKEYDISFHYDPTFLYDPTAPMSTSAVGPGTSSSSVERKQSNRGISSEQSQEHRQMTVHVSLQIEGENHIFKLKGTSPLYNPIQVISIKSKEFPELRTSDLLDKLDDTWPKFERGGQILLPNNRGTETFSNRTKLETLFEGTKGQKKKYDLIFEQDPTAQPPKPTAPRPKKTRSGGVGGGVGAGGGGGGSVVPAESAPPPRKNISISSESLRTEEELLLEVEIVPVTYKVTVRARGSGGTQSGRCEIGEGEFGTSLDDILRKAGIAWPEGKREGQHSDTKKTIISSDSLQKFVRTNPSQNFQCSFKIPSKVLPSSVQRVVSSTRGIKPHKTGSFDQLKIEIRIFFDNVWFLNIRGQGKDFKGDMEMNFKENEYDRLTVDELLGKLGRRWPFLDPEGWLQKVDSPALPINGPSRLVSVGIVGDKSRTVSYQLIFPISDEQPPPIDHAAVKAAASERVASRYPNTGAAGASSAAVPAAAISRSGINEGTIGVNVRIFFDSGVYNLQLTGSGGDFRGDIELNVRKEEFNGLTFGDLKKKLRRWPETASTGKFHTQSGNIAFTDQDKLVSIGLTAGTDGLPVVHQFSWEMI